jgi:organic hydroperoxide reductase OsmC/OhrA
MTEHHYHVITKWKGDSTNGTANVRTYDRSHTISILNKPELHLTTDNPAVGDKTKLNPEDLLVSAISSCHMLSYLYVCAVEGIVVLEYTDQATGIMIEKETGGGQFKSVSLNPVVKVRESSMMERAKQLHHKAHSICYIANSVNFPVDHHPEIISAELV